jgi:periplasmic copper chaperone A
MKIALKAAAAGLMFVAFAAQAEEFKAGNLTIDHAWARPSAGTAKMSAAYMTLKNAGKEADTLKSASSPVAGDVSIHENIMDNGVMKMRAVQGGLAIPAGGEASLKPGGHHIMLMGLKQPLEVGQTIPLKLSFAKAGDTEIQAKIEKMPEAAASGPDHHH